MKTIAFLSKAAVALSVALLFSCQNFDLAPGLEGDGNVITESRNNDTAFTGIEISRGLELEIEQSDEQSITVVADKNLQDHISTDINNGILTITSDVNINNATSKKIIVKIPKITSLQASSAAAITGKNVLKGQNIGLSTSSAGELKVSLEAENVTAETSSGSTMILQGKALKLETDTSTGSTIDAEELLANDVIADASSDSNAKVSPIVSLKANANSGSHIQYHNDPKILNKNSGSGGSISKK